MVCAVMPHCPRHDDSNASKVYRAISESPGITSKGIQERTGIDRRGVFTALRGSKKGRYPGLIPRGEVVQRPSFRDARQSKFYTAPFPASCPREPFEVPTYG